MSHHPTTPPPDGHGDMDMNMMGHGMTFHFGTSATILFDFWKPYNVGTLLASMVVICLMGVAYEGLKFLRDYLLIRHQKSVSFDEFRGPTEPGSNTTLTRQRLETKPIGMFSTVHIIQTVLHFVQFILSYFLMLIFMTFNVWLCLATALGIAIGYFVFGWQKSKNSDTADCCH